MANYVYANVNPQVIAAPDFQRPTPLVGTVDGTNKVFTWPHPPGFSFVVTLGGIWMTLGTDYTSSNTPARVITFETAPVVRPIGYW